jgi:hypothetical protein
VSDPPKLPAGPKPFHWRDTAATLRAVEAAAAGARLQPATRGFALLGAAGEVLAKVRVPVVLRLGHVGAVESADALLARADRPLGEEVVLLLRAGDAALGHWRDGELVAHKVFSRYVVRGHGKAQAAHLKTKGKSRYGSRLRLQNAARLLSEVNERLNEWWDATGGFAALYVACPERLWPDLLAAEPAPRWRGALEPIDIPLHVHTPRHEELLRVRGALEWGAVEWLGAAD